MTLELSLTKKSNPELKQHFEFFRYPVVLGREDKNDVPLPDPAKIISRKHAKIIDTEGILQIIDLGSANLTYLNDVPLIANDENVIKNGDVIRIGDYQIEVNIRNEKVDTVVEDQRTVLFTNPFTEDANLLIQQLKIIAAKYSQERSPMKENMLKMALMDMKSEDNGDLNKIIAEFFADYVTNISSSVPAAGEIYKEPVIRAPYKETVKDAYVPEEKYLSSHFTNSVDVLLSTFIKLIQGFLQFRQEFFGVTIYHTIPTGSLQEIKQYLFSPENSTEEEKKKFNLLEEETKKLLTHQIGLLEGYRSSVTEGTQNLLQALDPQKVEKEVTVKINSQGGLAKFIPMLKKVKILEALQENFNKNLSDPYHIEKRFFRPPFLKGYQTRSLQNKH